MTDHTKTIKIATEAEANQNDGPELPVVRAEPGPAQALPTIGQDGYLSRVERLAVNGGPERLAPYEPDACGSRRV